VSVDVVATKKKDIIGAPNDTTPIRGINVVSFTGWASRAIMTKVASRREWSGAT